MWQFRDEEGRRGVRHDLMSRREGLLADEQPDESTLRESTQTVEVTDAVFFHVEMLMHRELSLTLSADADRL